MEAAPVATPTLPTAIAEETPPLPCDKEVKVVAAATVVPPLINLSGAYLKWYKVDNVHTSDVGSLRESKDVHLILLCAIKACFFIIVPSISRRKTSAR